MRRTLVVLVAMLAARPADAQLAGTITRSSTTGPMLSASAQFGNIQFEGSPVTQKGSGAVVSVGYGFNSLFMLVLSGASAIMQSDGGDFPMRQVDLGARFHLAGANRRWVPFLEVGFGSRRVVHENFSICSGSTCQQGDMERSGLAFSQTLGVSFYPVQRFAVTTNFQFNEGALDHVTFNDAETLGFERNARSMRFSIGGSFLLRSRKP